MDLELIRRALGWCCVFHLVLLFYWALMIMFAQDLVHRLHNKWFPLTREDFVRLHYVLLGTYKIIAITFAFIPYFALRMIA
ncbi:MAG: hypothetical protein KC900_08240 [Candidatus Omnitrophica bacterium]|nr:hypothetical protein [Candidatus Omnitrophota bacterium]